MRGLANGFDRFREETIPIVLLSRTKGNDGSIVFARSIERIFKSLRFQSLQTAIAKRRRVIFDFQSVPDFPHSTHPRKQLCRFFVDLSGVKNDVWYDSWIMAEKLTHK